MRNDLRNDAMSSRLSSSASRVVPYGKSIVSLRSTLCLVFISSDSHTMIRIFYQSTSRLDDNRCSIEL